MNNQKIKNAELKLAYHPFGVVRYSLHFNEVLFCNAPPVLEAHDCCNFL